MPIKKRVMKNMPYEHKKNVLWKTCPTNIKKRVVENMPYKHKKRVVENMPYEPSCGYGIQVTSANIILIKYKH